MAAWTRLASSCVAAPFSPPPTLVGAATAGGAAGGCGWIVGVCVGGAPPFGVACLTPVGAPAGIAGVGTRLAIGLAGGGPLIAFGGAAARSACFFAASLPAADSAPASAVSICA